MSGAGYTFEHVTMIAGGVTILNDVNLDVAGSGLTVIAGPSGSGKSTLLRLCNRLEVPTTGRVLLDGCDLADLDPLALRRRAGMVFQRPITFPGTVADNLAIADPDGLHAPVEALARVGLDPALLERRADDLSGGEAQRMCVARALLTDPEVLLLDEATSALDVDARAVIEALIVELVDAGLCAMWVTHDLDQADRLAGHGRGRVVVVLDGRPVPGDEASRYLAARSFTSGESGRQNARRPASDGFRDDDGHERGARP